MTTTLTLTLKLTLTPTPTPTRYFAEAYLSPAVPRLPYHVTWLSPLPGTSPRPTTSSTSPPLPCYLVITPTRYFAEAYHQQYLASPGARPYCSAQPQVTLPSYHPLLLRPAAGRLCAALRLVGPRCPQGLLRAPAPRRLLEAVRARQGMQRCQLAQRADRDEVEMQAEMRWRCKRRCDGDSSTRPTSRDRDEVEIAL
eukprot:scaffold86188_cov42-Phaeocystis_antarctica.AAC.2